MSAELNIQLDLVNDRVEAGMEWLDRVSPDWWLDINADLLDMADGNRCVLGQLAQSAAWRGKVEAYAQDNYLVGHNGYALFAGVHNMGWVQPMELGFLGVDLLMGEDYGVYVRALEARWFQVISVRQGQRLLPGMQVRELVASAP